MPLDLTAYDALSFDCYGTLIDWEAGIAAVLGPWARRRDPVVTDERVLVAYADNEAAVEREAPSTPYPDVLREAFRRTGRDLGIEVTDADADALGTSVPDWPAFPDSAEALDALVETDAAIGRLLSALERGGRLQHTNIVLVSDHGMAEVPPGQVIAVEDMVDPDHVELVSAGQSIGFAPRPGHEAAAEHTVQLVHAQSDARGLRGACRLLRMLDHPVGGGLRPVGGAKGVVDVDIA